MDAARQAELLALAGKYLAGGGKMKRGLLVNPNEKFYISIAHTDADVDQTLAIVDQAFAAVKQQRIAT